MVENHPKAVSMQFELRKNEELSQYTTLHLGGVADYVAIVKSEEELQAAFLFAKEQTKKPPLILGGGSNVLCADAGYRGLVIINKIKGYDLIEDAPELVKLKIGAGEVFDKIVEKTISDGYWGLENLSSIPGSVGATPIQNVGAYGVEISELVECVEAININTNEKKKFVNEECCFGYRDSFFKTELGRQWCVTHVVYKLSKLENKKLSYKDMTPLQTSLPELTQQEIRDHVIKIRAKKFPNWQEVGTAGSFFKNPIISKERYKQLQKSYVDLPGFEVDEDSVKVSLGWILDKVCKLKGHCEGNICLYEGQALVLITKNKATALEVELFANKIQRKVFEKTEIKIEREVLSVK